MYGAKLRLATVIALLALNMYADPNCDKNCGYGSSSVNGNRDGCGCGTCCNYVLCARSCSHGGIICNYPDGYNLNVDKCSGTTTVCPC